MISKAQNNFWSLGNFEVNHQKPGGIQLITKYYLSDEQETFFYLQVEIAS